MSKLIVIWEESREDIKKSLVKPVEDIGKELGLTVELYPAGEKLNHLFFQKIEKEEPDYIVTFDMVGFEISTLLENTIYNILYAKQIHILLSQDKRYRQFLKKELAMNLFLFVTEEKLFQKYRVEYPHLLNLESMPSLIVVNKPAKKQQEENKKVLSDAMKRVYEEVRTTGLY